MDSDFLRGRYGIYSSEYIAEEKPEALVTSVSLDPSWTYAEFSKINSGTATFRQSTAEKRKNITVCVNAGHGTSGGASVKTLCHPDGSPKVTSGHHGGRSHHGGSSVRGHDICGRHPGEPGDAVHGIDFQGTSFWPQAMMCS